MKRAISVDDPQTTLVRVTHLEGLHIRPVANIVAFIESCGDEVQIRPTGGQWTRADSLLTLLALGLRVDDEVEIAVIGPSAEKTIIRLKALF